MKLYYSISESIIHDERLSTKELGVLSYLIYAKESSRSGKVPYPNAVNVAKRFKCTPQTIRIIFSRLKELGYLNQFQTKGADGWSLHIYDRDGSFHS